ncbi:hypothetical protein KCU67_g1193, partial [Aureobasidium melanogenum]
MDPEIVVGIDFGMTCTGVAYSMAPDWAAPTTIQHWPGRPSQNLNKVDTMIVYHPTREQAVAWGFLIDRDASDELEIQSLFKLFLDPAHKPRSRHIPDVREARKWFVDYMRCLYRAIVQRFDDSYARWSTRRLEFLFSVPTTWKNPAMVAEIEALIKQAGFSSNKNHTVRISLTEAEAAAVCISKQGYEKGDVFLVCDAGGGTTDINILKIKNTEPGQHEIEPLDWVEGTAVGSTLIDFKIEELVLERLERIQEHLPAPAELLAEKMVNCSGFQTFKCSFGLDAQEGLDLFLTIPTLAIGLDFPESNIQDSRMRITREEFQQVFDERIEKVFELIDMQIKQLQNIHSRETINYLILSGGLGSSPYVKQRMRKRYEQNADMNLQNARDIKILTAPEPQLVVTHGLVMDRVQKLKGSSGIYPEKCCRNSYGLVVRLPYDPTQHIGEDVSIDPRDGKKWAEKQVHWFIRQGQKVSVEKGISEPYRMKINVGQETVPWRTQVVMCSLPAAQLPKSIKHHSVKSVCHIESVLDPLDMKLKNRHWYNIKPRYKRAQFVLKVLLGSADMRFQLWGNGQRLSKDHEEIGVMWYAPTEKGDAPTEKGDMSKVVVQDTFEMYPV